MQSLDSSQFSKVEHVAIHPHSRVTAARKPVVSPNEITKRWRLTHEGKTVHIEVNDGFSLGNY